MLRRLLAPVEIMRPHNMLAAALSVSAGYHVAGGRDLATLAIPFVITALVTGAGNVINDYFDVAIDRVNKPRRPLPSGRLSSRAALVLYTLVSLTIPAVAFITLPVAIAVVMLVWQLVLLAYAARVKRVLVFGNLLIAATTSSAFWVGAALAGDHGAALVPVAIAFAFVLSREVVKGAEDVDGDEAAGVGTLAVAFGVPRAAAVAFVLMLVLAMLIPVPAIISHYGLTYFWLMETLVVPGLLISAYLVMCRPGKRVFNRVSWILKAGMFFGILAIALGRS